MTESIYSVLDDNAEMFYKALKYGRVRGVAVLVPPVHFKTNSPASDSISRIVRELVERDIMVTLTSPIHEAMNNAGLSAEELSRNAGYGLAELCGYLGVDPVLFLGTRDIDNDPLKVFRPLSRHAERELSDLPMGIFSVNDDPISVADSIDEVLHQKRLGIEWCDRYYCSLDTFS